VPQNRPTPTDVGDCHEDGTSRTIRLAIVGGGVAGIAHARAAAAHPGLDLAAVVERSKSGRRCLADLAEHDLGVTRPASFRDLDELLMAADVDLVALCTPSGVHSAQALATLQAGRHVLVEKPVDTRLSRARLLSDAAADAAMRGQVASVVSQRRFSPSNIAIVRAVRAGRLGDLTSAAVVVPWWRDASYFASSAWRGTWDGDGGGALMHQGIHFVDLLMEFLGEPDVVAGMTGSDARPELGVEDTAAAIIQFTSGVLATVLVTTSACSGPAASLQIHGSRGSISTRAGRIDFARLADHDGGKHSEDLELAAEPTSRNEGESPSQGDPSRPDDGPLFADHLRQYDDVVAAIRDGRAPRVTINDGLRALALVTAVYVSNALRSSIRYADVLAGEYDQMTF
jgi:UDP-N-acetyl-2-amino-2-deoxyglucuronate dehydrogenase